MLAPLRHGDGRRDQHAVRPLADREAREQPATRGDPLDLVPDLLDRLEPEVGAEPAARSAAIIQSAWAVPGGVTFWASA